VCVSVCVCVCACGRACVRACVRVHSHIVRVCACVLACACVRAPACVRALAFVHARVRACAPVGARHAAAPPPRHRSTEPRRAPPEPLSLRARRCARSPAARAGGERPRCDCGGWCGGRRGGGGADAGTRGPESFARWRRGAPQPELQNHDSRQETRQPLVLGTRFALQLYRASQDSGC
jgi:hypothetical protein